MRRPPVVLIIVAVLVTGVSVGWAAGTGTESPSLADQPGGPGEPVVPEGPELSSVELSGVEGTKPEPADDTEDESTSATTRGDGPELLGAESLDVPVETVTAPAATTTPSHLEEKTIPAEPEPEPVAAPTTTTTTTVAPAPERSPQTSVGFSAAQHYGSCEEPIPYDIFSGTAEPGSTVRISSPYGSGTTTADGSGHWERKVEFSDAPRGGTFTVTASGVGGSKTFDFTVGH